MLEIRPDLWWDCVELMSVKFSIPTFILCFWLVVTDVKFVL